MLSLTRYLRKQRTLRFKHNVLTLDVSNKQIDAEIQRLQDIFKLPVIEFKYIPVICNRIMNVSIQAYKNNYDCLEFDIEAQDWIDSTKALLKA